MVAGVAPVGQGAVRPSPVVLGGEGVQQAMVVGWAGWARSHFFMVCWKRSTLPWVWGCQGRPFFRPGGRVSRRLLALRPKQDHRGGADRRYPRIDGPYPNFRDSEGYLREARRAAALGYTGKWAIHPDQIPFANEVFTPTQDEIDRAKRTVEAYRAGEAQGLGAVSVDGMLVDAAHIKLAEIVLQQAAEASGTDTEPETGSGPKYPHTTGSTPV